MLEKMLSEILVVADQTGWVPVQPVHQGLGSEHDSSRSVQSAEICSGFCILCSWDFLTGGVTQEVDKLGCLFGEDIGKRDSGATVTCMLLIGGKEGTIQ